MKNNKILNNIFVYTMALVLMAVVATMSGASWRQLIREVNVFVIAVSVCINFAIYLIYSWQLAFVMQREYGAVLRLSDYFLLPVMTHLWGYLIPSQGGMLFSACYMRQKYGIGWGGGYAIGLYTFAVSVVVIGLAAVVVAVWGEMPGLLMPAALVSVSPLLLFPLDALLQRFSPARGWLQSVATALHSISGQLRAMAGNGRYNGFVAASTLGSLLLHCAWYYWAATALGYHYPWWVAVVMAVAARLSGFVKVLPGNVGIQELAVASGLLYTGGSFEQGAAIALFIRASSLIPALTLGVWGTLHWAQKYPLLQLKNVAANIK